MKIYCKSENFKPSVPINQQINRVGKYLYKNIDGAFKFKTGSNQCDVYFKLLYEVPYLERIPGKQKEGYNDLHEMIIDLNITTYQNRLRVNILEVTPDERTIGSDVYKPELLENLNQAFVIIYDKLCKRIAKAYEDYDFIF